MHNTAEILALPVIQEKPAGVVIPILSEEEKKMLDLIAKMITSSIFNIDEP